MFLNMIVVLKAKNNISDKTIKKYDAILVLGAGIWDNEPSPMLADRLDAAISAYNHGYANKIIMSGDHGKDTYDEVNVMKKYAIEKGVPSEDIFMDHAGFSTYDSIYRAKYIFKANSLIIVTQKYHLYRSLYISDCLKIEAIGIPANPRKYMGAFFREIREVLARDKDFFKCIIKPKSTYLGEEIPVNGDGNITNDRDDELELKKNITTTTKTITTTTSAKTTTTNTKKTTSTKGTTIKSTTTTTTKQVTIEPITTTTKTTTTTMQPETTEKVLSDSKRLPLEHGKIKVNYNTIQKQNGKPYHYIKINGITEGDKVYSMYKGTITKVIKNSVCGGTAVYINHEIDKLVSYEVIYAGMDNTDMKVGDLVDSNTIIGTIGNLYKKDGCLTGIELWLRATKKTKEITDTNDPSIKISKINKESGDPNDIIEFPNEWDNR